MIFLHRISARLPCYGILLLMGGLTACASTQPAPAPGVSASPTPEVESRVIINPEPEPEPVEIIALPAEPFNRDDVMWIQQRLQELGYYEGEVDGSSGQATRTAIDNYQKDQGMDADGKPTAELREFMWRNGG